MQHSDGIIIIISIIWWETTSPLWSVFSMLYIPTIFISACFFRERLVVCAKQLKQKFATRIAKEVVWEGKNFVKLMVRASTEFLYTYYVYIILSDSTFFRQTQSNVFFFLAVGGCWCYHYYTIIIIILS